MILQQSQIQYIMKRLSCLSILLLWVAYLYPQTGANELVSFLEGNWHTHGFSVADGIAVGKQDYLESMEVKDAETLIITAYDYLDGKDITREMKLILSEDAIIMRQGDFKAKGRKEGNVYYLSGNYNDREYRFRLYTLGDKYVFHREVWTDGQVEKMDMSYLIRRE